MSWSELLKNNLVIVTGDGKEYRPLWMPKSKTIEYNIAEFEFPKVVGTLVKRTEPKGRRFDLELYFQGANHVEEANAFETSCNDKRAWTLTHPYYGVITCQPTSIIIDNTSYNTSKISTTVIETITEDFPKGSVAVQDQITQTFLAVDDESAETFGNEVTPNQSDINQMKANNLSSYNSGSALVTPTLSERYFNAFTDANAAITTATQKPLEAMRKAQAVITAPARFEESVKGRMNLLTNQFNTLRTTLVNITTKNQKGIYQSQAGSIINAMCFASGTPQEADYQNANDVLDNLELLLNNYNQYLTDLDTLQSNNGGNPNSFIPNIQLQILLNSLLNFTASNLFNIAANARQERAIFCEDDTNIILLAHRFYGLDLDDVNIDNLILTNQIGLKEILNIRKGRKILYYV
jgi:prophage DNA circulation protein